MIAVSTACYALGRELGMQDAVAEFNRQVSAPPSPEALPVVRVIQRLAEFDDVKIMMDPLATSIGRHRCHALDWAYQSKADVWVSCDDDVEVDPFTIESLLRAVGWQPPAVLNGPPRYASHAPRGQIVFVPCLLRSSELNRVNVRLLDDRPRSLASTAPILASGFGMAALSWAALHALIEHYTPELSYTDERGETRCALFAETIEGGRWYGEDIAFCRRARAAGFELEALLDGCSVHAGRGLVLSELDRYEQL